MNYGYAPVVDETRLGIAQRLSGIEYIADLNYFLELIELQVRKYFDFDKSLFY
jgi:hypothetical protein